MPDPMLSTARDEGQGWVQPELGDRDLMAEMLLAEEKAREEAEGAAPLVAAFRKLAEEKTEDLRYANLRLVGEGSFGFIFKATDMRRGERVALKIIRGALDSPFTTKRVLRELTILRVCR